MKIVFRGATIWRLKPAFALGQVENKEENGWRNIFAEGKLCWENPSEWNPKILARLNRHFCFITRHISFQSFRPLSINLAFLSVPGLVHGFILVWQHSSCPYPGCLEIPANDWTDPPPAWFYHRFQGFFISRQNCLHSSPPPQVQTTHAGFLSILKHIKRINPQTLRD